jgi:UPF0755 protein
LALTIAIGWWLWANQPVSEKEPETSPIFVIKKGESLTSVAERLDQQGLVRSALAFKLLVLHQGLASQIQAGDFRLNPTLPTGEIAQALTKGTLDIWLTFPEGWRREQFGQRLASSLSNFDYQQFLAASRGQEGYLFPDTYLIPQKAGAVAVVKILSNNFEKKFSPELKKAAQGAGLNQEQVVILASIVEREAKYDADRPLIAGILIKRWQNNWPLQADATVQYVLANSLLSISESPSDDFSWWPTVRKKDLKISSPYNTYLNKNLPPKPICNPGLASIKAVIDSQESDYWFYLSDLSGKVHYARTNEEQNQNIQKYLNQN